MCLIKHTPCANCVLLTPQHVACRHMRRLSCSPCDGIATAEKQLFKQQKLLQMNIDAN